MNEIHLLNKNSTIEQMYLKLIFCIDQKPMHWIGYHNSNFNCNWITDIYYKSNGRNFHIKSKINLSTIYGFDDDYDNDDYDDDDVDYTDTYILIYFYI